MSNQNLLATVSRGMTTDEAETVAPALKALADPVRLRLLSEIAAHPGHARGKPEADAAVAAGPAGSAAVRRSGGRRPLRVTRGA